MKIAKIKTTHLRNDEHFMFHTEFKELVSEHGAAALKIQPQFETYLTLYHAEDEGIKKINKSAITAEIQKADKARDVIWGVLVKANSAALWDFDHDVQKAAKRLKILFDTYGNIAKKPLNEQTSAAINILQDLHGEYAADVAAVGIGRWVEELQARNDALRALTKERYDETTLKTDVVLKEARAAVDEAYKSITERIGAYVLLEGVAAYEMFIRSLNTVIDKYNETLARRGSKKKETANATSAEVTAEM